GAALGDVAQAQARRLLEELRAVFPVDRVHLQRGDADEEPRPRELVLELVRAQHVAHVLAQEALDALAEFLNAVDVGLLPPPRRALARLERRDALVHLEVPRHVGDQVTDQRERLHRPHGHRLARREMIHARLAHERWLAVHLGAAGAALGRLAVPSHREIGGAMRLDPMDGVQHHHAGLDGHAILDLLAAAGVAAEHAHHRLAAAAVHARALGSAAHRATSCFAAGFASNSALSSGGICGSGVAVTCIPDGPRVTQWLTCPSAGSSAVKSSREWAPRLSFRSSAERATASDTVSMFWRSRARCQPG